MNKFKTSLIISTYNRVDALLVCLDSIRHQTTLPDEVIVGDDGSTSETRDAIEKIKANYPVPLIHVWHEDNGFQLAKMRNKSVAKASGDYIIEVDGDLMLSSNFVEDHLYLAEEGYYLKGGRCNLNEKLTAEICKAGKSRLIHLWTKNIDTKRENILRNRLLLSFLALRYRTTSSPALGCNMSFWKKDFININGYDEFFIGWGGEDYDFANRLQRSSIKKKYLKFGGNVFHLWHEDKYMDNAEKNSLYSVEQKQKGTIRCEIGVDQYL